MRVAIVQEQVDVQRGGAETSTLEMARYLATLGPSVTVICAAPRSDPFVDQNVTFLPVATGGLTRAQRTYRFVQGVHRLCWTERFDIVHAVTPCLCANIYQPRGGTYPETVARSAAMSPPALRPLRHLVRRFNIRQRFLLRIERMLLGKHGHNVHVAAVSDYVRRQVLAIARIPESRVHVIFNGVEVPTLAPATRQQQRLDLRATLNAAADAPVLLFAAHNFKLKGLRELLHALALGRERSPAWTLAVAGRDDPRPYRRLANRLGVAGQVHFLGADAELPGWYAAVDVLAHPTWYDPCSRVVLEALGVGLPVVTTRYNGAAEVIEPGRHGVVIDEPADAAGLFAALCAALVPRLRDACAADAPRMAPRVSMARHAQDLVSLYERVVAPA
jgi:UDP-glucose:(heptosyl)LPS alpha-1,3-glucosyltransferase